MFNSYLSYLPYILFVIVILLVISIIIYLYYLYSDDDSESDKEIANKKENANKVCISIDDYNALILAKSKNEETRAAAATSSDTIARDRRVLNDQLYPPLNRSDNRTHTNLTNNINRRNMYVNTNDIRDTYRLIGYVTNNAEEKDTGNNNWKLFARQKDRHFSDFYLKPTDNNNDIKVTITDNIVVGGRLRDIYDIPKSITFNSPMLNKEPYDIVEVPKADLSRSADYI